MATSIERKLAKHLECPVCLEIFKEPKVLSCQHSCCRKCLERLVTRMYLEGVRLYKVTCPECRQGTEVPGGDVSRLPTNFLLNNLLSLHKNAQQPGKKSAICAKHDGEMLKLFCQTCEQPICRDCTIVDHRGHRYSFIKDVFDAEEEKVLKIVSKSKEIISFLESSVEEVDKQELELQESSLKECQCIDSFIDEQIVILKVEGERLKNKLQNSISNQEGKFRTQKDFLFLSLGCLKSSVEVIEEAISRGDKAAVLASKSPLFQHLLQCNARFKPCDTIYYTLKIDAPLDKETVRKMAHIRKNKEYKLSMCGGPFGHLEETYVNYNYNFIISKKKYNLDFSKIPKSDFSVQNTDRPERSREYDPFFALVPNCAKVRIKSPRSMQICSSVIKDVNDCFFFSYRPEEIGTYKIEVIVKSHYIQGSPFDWIVKEFVTAKNYMKMDDEY